MSSKRRKISKNVNNEGDESEDDGEQVDEKTKEFRFALYDVVHEVVLELAEKRGFNEGIMEGTNEIFKDSSKQTQINHLLYVYPVAHLEYRWNILRNAIQKTRVKKLSELYAKFFGKKKLSKKALVNDLLTRFYGIESNLDKREMEDENVNELQSYLKSEEFRFFSLCGFTLTNEIVDQILEFLPRNFSIISSVGGSAKYLYIKLLSTWDYIRVSKGNLYEISTLALKNVKHIALQEKINMSEVEYLWDHISSSLQKLTIRVDFKYFRSILNSIHKLHKKSLRKNKKDHSSYSYPFSNLRELKIKAYFTYHPKEISPIKNCTFNQIFPRLEKIVNIQGSQFELDMFGEECGIKELQIHRSYSTQVPLLYTRLNGSNNLIRSLQNSLKVLSCRFSNIYIFPRDDSLDGNIIKFIRSFPRLETLNIHIKTSEILPPGGNPGDRIFDFAGILSDLPESCKRVKIENRRWGSLRNRRSEMNSKFLKLDCDASVPVTLLTTNETPPPSIESLEIISSDVIDHFYRVHDFNLEEILESNFLSIQSSRGRLRSFTADLPLGSRKKRILYRRYVMEMGEKLDSEMKEFVTIIHLFTDFMEETMFNNFKYFDLTIRSGDRFFFDEDIQIKYDFKVARRLKITYSPTSQFVEEYQQLFQQKKKNEDDEDVQDEESFFDLSQFLEITHDDILQEYEILREEKRPCLMIFKKILEDVMWKIINHVDIFEISVLLKKKQENVNAFKSSICNFLKSKKKEIDGFFQFEEIDQDNIVLLTRSSWM